MKREEPLPFSLLHPYQTASDFYFIYFVCIGPSIYYDLWSTTNRTIEHSCRE